MGAQKAIAEAIIRGRADYVLALKGNHESLHRAVIEHVDDQLEGDLKGAQELMKKADHDYQGHRVKAMKEVHNAVLILREGSANPKKKKGFKAGSSGGGLPQDQSDALLKQAVTQIQAVQNSLANVQDSRAMQAAVALQRVLQELQTALQIK